MLINLVDLVMGLGLAWVDNGAWEGHVGANINSALWGPRFGPPGHGAGASAQLAVLEK